MQTSTWALTDAPKRPGCMWSHQLDNREKEKEAVPECICGWYWAVSLQDSKLKGGSATAVLNLESSKLLKDLQCPLFGMLECCQQILEGSQKTCAQTQDWALRAYSCNLGSCWKCTYPPLSWAVVDDTWWKTQNKHHFPKLLVFAHRPWHIIL